jgi:hypothetical protein
METFGVGIAGAGMIGTVHAKVLAELEDARLVAVSEAAANSPRAMGPSGMPSSMSCSSGRTWTW